MSPQSAVSSARRGGHHVGDAEKQSSSGALPSLVPLVDGLAAAPDAAGTPPGSTVSGPPPAGPVPVALVPATGVPAPPAQAAPASAAVPATAGPGRSGASSSPAAPSRSAPTPRRNPPVIPAWAVPDLGHSISSTLPGLLGGVGLPLTGLGWKAFASHAAARLRLPVGFVLIAVVFVLVQALVDRRDPKVVAAPEHASDDSVGFE